MFRFLLPYLFTFSFFGFCTAAETATAPADHATTTPTEAEKPLVVKENNLFVLALMYFPEIPKDLPKDTKPSQYLKGLTLETAKFVASDNPLILSVDPALKVDGKSAADFFKEKQKFALPFTVSYVDSEKKTTLESKGAFLMEVKSAYKNFQDLKASYTKPITQDAIWELDANGAFKEPSQGTSSVTDMKITSGTIAVGWSDQSKADALAVTAFFYETMGCFVATAIYDSWTAPQLATLRVFRDKILKTSESGAHLVNLYYQVGPYWAQDVKANSTLKACLQPALDAFVILTEHVDLDNSFVRGIFHGVIYSIDWLFGSSLEAQKDALHQQGSPLLVEMR